MRSAPGPAAMNVARCLTLLALMLAGPCIGAEPDNGSDMFRGSQSVDGKTDRRPTMSIAQLRVCVALEDEARALRRDFDSAKLALELAERDFRSIDYIVQTLKQTLDLEDGREVDDYNLKVAEQGRALDAYNARIDPYNRLIDAVDAATTRFNAECTRPYLERDMLAVRVEREAAIRASMERDGKP
jgi:hypothetical protein